MSIFTSPRWKEFTTTGALAVGAKVYFFETGTSTPKATYPTSADATALTNANSHPVIMDSNGSAQIWPTSGQYRVRVDSKDDVVQTGYPIDAIQGSGVVVEAGGDLTISATSDIIVNTDKFVVLGATGNTTINGTTSLNSTVTISDDLQMANNKSIAMRNVGNTAYIDCLTLSTSDNTVLNSTTAKDVIIQTAGGVRMTVKASGNVGINEVLPSELLEVSGSGTDDATILISSGGPATLAISSGSSSDTSKIHFRELTSTQYSMFYQSGVNQFVLFDHNNNNQDMTFDNGNVGFNTDSPNVTSVNGTVVTIKAPNTANNVAAMEVVGDNVSTGNNYAILTFPYMNGGASVVSRASMQISRLTGNLSQMEFLTGGASPTVALTIDGLGKTITKAPVTASAGFNLASGTTPTTLVNGDVWFNGTNMFIRIGGVTKTFTVS